jgi:subtilase family serine protease
MTRPRRQRLHPSVEGLDARWLLSASGRTPAQIETAYGLGGLTFGGQAANGSGQTIAIVDAFNDPNIQTELAVFDSTNNLPAPPSLRVVSQTGNTALPTVDAGWAQEEALDVEWAHALAPGASIVVVEAYSGTIPDLMAGVRTAAGIAGVSVVTMSWSGSENLYASPYYDGLFATPGITFVAASGDNGFSGGVQYPASSPNVLAVGGTTLQVDSSGNYLGETPWSGTSGGSSSIEPEPSYQLSVQSTGARSTPDVAFDGNPDTGVEVYSMNPYSGQGSWMTIAGTSLAAQAWGALIAIVDQGRALDNQGTLGSDQTLTALYSLPTSDFHSVSGGFNQQTGLGTPNGAGFIDDLVAFSPNSGQSDSVAGTPVPATPPVTSHTKGHHKKVVHHRVVINPKAHPHPMGKTAAKHKSSPFVP